VAAEVERERRAAEDRAASLDRSAARVTEPTNAGPLVIGARTSGDGSAK
jgi:hypothetical protein